MTKSPKQENSATEPVTMGPPTFSVSPLSNKYEFMMDFKWDKYEKQIRVSRETFNFEDELVQKLNETFVTALYDWN